MFVLRWRHLIILHMRKTLTFFGMIPFLLYYILLYGYFLFSPHGSWDGSCLLCLAVFTIQ